MMYVKYLAQAWHEGHVLFPLLLLWKKEKKKFLAMCESLRLLSRD